MAMIPGGLKGYEKKDRILWSGHRGAMNTLIIAS